MECKRGWSSEFMAANFPLVFRNSTLRKQRRKVLLEREKAMLPAIQVYVEYKKAGAAALVEENRLKALFGSHPMRNQDFTAWEQSVSGRFEIMARERRRIKYALADLKARLSALKAEEPRRQQEIVAERQRRAILREQDAALEPRWVEMHNEYQVMSIALTNAQQLRWRNEGLYNDTYSDGAPQTRREFIMKCPDEGCRGFLSSAYKCGTCAKNTCTQCLVVLGEDAHTCNPDTVETAKTIRSETRPCPKCGTRIFKIDGCDQMWCVMNDCNTAFSWNSGHIVTGNVHNPHYYEWLRRTGGGAPEREVGDIPCGGLPHARVLARVVYATEIDNNVKNVIMETHRNMRDLIDVRLRDYPARPPQLMNKDIDVAYLMNELTEEAWQRQLELSEAKFKRKKEIGQILQTLATAGSDIINTFLQQAQTLDDILYENWLVTEGFPELERLREFGNESLKTLAKRDHMAVPQLEKNWEWKPLRALYRKTPSQASIPPTAE